MTLPQNNNSQEAEDSTTTKKYGIGKMILNVLSFLLFGVFKICLLIMKGLWWFLRDTYMGLLEQTRNERNKSR